MHGMQSDAMNSSYSVFKSFYVLENHICSKSLQIILNHNIKKFLKLHSTETVKFFFFQLDFFFTNHAVYICNLKVISAQHSLIYITILYNKNNVTVLLVTSFLLWTHAIIITGTVKHQRYTMHHCILKPSMVSTKYKIYKQNY
jgi:hypothetical protein